ncbi:MAG TPA: DUF1684 domain-containing protein [Ktedonobacterales bacterium]
MAGTKSSRDEYVRYVDEQRRRKDRFFSTSPQSPIPYVERRAFAGLAYYPPDPEYRVTAEVALFPDAEVLRMATSTGEIRPQARYAELRFTLDDRQYRLFGFTEPHDHHVHELFVPFRDATSGRETYGAGRYLEVELHQPHQGAETVTIDFNLAYNPFCAYSPDYSCPIPPPENTLPVVITAGERAYLASHSHHHSHT